MKDWSVEDAQAAQAEFVAAGGQSYDPAAPIFQWVALQQIEQFREWYEAGESFALLHAVSECARCGLVMPDWVVRGFLERYRDVIHYKSRTLDEAFGTYLPKGAKLPGRRKKWEKGIIAWSEVRRRHEHNDEPIDEALFKRVGKDLNISGSTVRDYYYDWVARLTYKNSAK